MIYFLVSRSGPEGRDRGVDRVPVVAIQEKRMYDLVLCKVKRGSRGDSVWVHHNSLQETVAGSIAKAVQVAPLSPQPMSTAKEER